VLAAFTYSARKTTKSTRIALATLQGSTILNNTFVLALFMFLVYARSLAWEFFAETLTILVVEICVFCFSLKKTQTVLDATLILALYPLSLVAIIVLTMMGWD
jgi:Ca2+/Na+ antiporter